jgi:hypothetical protein
MGTLSGVAIVSETAAHRLQAPAELVGIVIDFAVIF